MIVDVPFVKVFLTEKRKKKAGNAINQRCCDKVKQLYKVCAIKYFHIVISAHSVAGFGGKKDPICLYPAYS